MYYCTSPTLLGSHAFLLSSVHSCSYSLRVCTPVLTIHPPSLVLPNAPYAGGEIPAELLLNIQHLHVRDATLGVRRTELIFGQHVEV